MDVERIHEIARACLLAVAESGAVLPDWEFSILVGFERDEMGPIAESWSIDDARSVRAAFAVVNNLVSYPGLTSAGLVRSCGVSSTDLLDCLEALRPHLQCR